MVQIAHYHLPSVYATKGVECNLLVEMFHSEEEVRKLEITVTSFMNVPLKANMGNEVRPSM